jgi:FkbM family methyltransferase
MVKIKRRLWLLLNGFASQLSSTRLANIQVFKRLYRWLSGIFSKEGVWLEYKGFDILLDPKTLVYNKINSGEIPEPIVSREIEKNVNNGDTVIDIGCRYGVQTLHMSKQVGQRGEVYSFDAFPKHIHFLDKTIERNDINNICAENLAVAEDTGIIDLMVPDNTGEVSIKKFEGEYKKKSVRSVRLDEYLKVNNIKQVDLMKIDVEGAEHSVIAGLRDELARVSMAVIEIHTNKLAKESLYQLYDILHRNGRLETHKYREIDSFNTFSNQRQIIWTK